MLALGRTRCSHSSLPVFMPALLVYHPHSMCFVLRISVSEDSEKAPFTPPNPHLLFYLVFFLLPCPPFSSLLPSPPPLLTFLFSLLLRPHLLCKPHPPCPLHDLYKASEFWFDSGLPLWSLHSTVPGGCSVHLASNIRVHFPVSVGSSIYSIFQNLSEGALLRDGAPSRGLSVLTPRPLRFGSPGSQNPIRLIPGTVGKGGLEEDPLFFL